ncbi:PIR Superfamily Protein [Plasmodium ovale wallikeri]|uniref:PIR Superfamily Protein n=1 Tax=Plasmodium ovale wallikeri TaxID=864142 RepID=A0A1A9AN51_PLAOA|nr:PIR Superfamily Protein [Plasmodium ovale wallikeri]
MSNKKNDFVLTELTNRFDSFKILDLNKYYDELEKSCKVQENSNPCDTFSSLEEKYSNVIPLLKKLFCNLDCSLKPQELFLSDKFKFKDKHCIYLKYWIYDKLITNGFTELEINLIFDFLKKSKNNFLNVLNSNKRCNLYKLSLNDIHHIKNLYDYYELLYDADIKIYDNVARDSKYLTYFKHGLDIYSRSKVKCLRKQNEYCHEFNEYTKIRNKNKTKTSFLSCKEKLLSSLNNEGRIITGELINKDEIPSYTLDPDLKKLLEKDKIDDKLPLHKYYGVLTERYKTYTTSDCNYFGEYPIKKKDTICKLWGSVKKMLEMWNDNYGKYNGLNSDKICDYFNYWLYDILRYIDAPLCDTDIFYYLWNQFTDKNVQGTNTCHSKSYYGFNSEQLENKIKLFHFLEYYGNMRDKLKEDNNNNKKDYCYYIQSMFELYKTMLYNNVSHVYSEELRFFRKIFWGNNEITFLKKKCPNMCLDLVFDVKYKTLCPLDEKPSVINELVDLNSCETAELLDNPDTAINNEKEYVFQDLNTSSVYNELNREVITDNYYSICSKLLPFSKENCGLYGLCIKLARNVKDLYHLKNKERTNRCEYITHWLFDRIQKILKIDTNNNYDTNALNEFFKVGYDIFHILGASDCLYNIINVNFDEQKEKKHLHDYFKDFDKIRCDNAINSMKCKSYCEYIEHINDLYGKYIGNCCYCFNSGGCMEMCPDYFKCDDTYNPYNLFETLKCKENEKFVGRLKKVVKPLSVDYHVIWLTENSEKEKEKSLLMLEEKESSIVSEKESSIVLEKESSSNPEKNCDKITCDPFYISTVGAFGLMGFLLISFILYKFTPMGSYFQNKDARNENIHFQKREEQFLEDDFELNRTNTENRRMRLAYHQA